MSLNNRLKFSYIKVSLLSVFTFLIFGSVIGCSNPLSENNDSKIDDNYNPGGPGSKAPLKSINSSLNINSATATKTSGTQVSMKVSLGHKQTKLSGTAVSAKISLNSGRVSQ